MRHGISGNKLGRNSSLRKATVRDIAKATLQRQRICTTKAKAKEARKLVDRLITLGKKGALAHRRGAFAILCNHKLVSELFDKIAPRFKERRGGYTRIIPLSLRRGDNAQLAYLELTEKEEVVVSKPKSRATGKSKKAVVDVDKSVAGGHEKQESSEEKKPGAKDIGQIKTASKRDPGGKDKGKVSKKVVGGIRKFFRRKTSE